MSDDSELRDDVCSHSVNDTGSVVEMARPLWFTPDRHVLNFLLLCAGFWGLFVAFGTTQNLESTLVPGRLGYWSLATVYVSFVVAALTIARAVVAVITPKFGLFVGGIGYVVFIGGNLYPQWYTMIPAAVVQGVCASVLWTSQGVFLTCTAVNWAKKRGLDQKSALGGFTGLFWGIFMTTLVVGNVIAGLILNLTNSGQSKRILFYVFLAIAAAGTACFLFLRQEAFEGAMAAKESPWAVHRHLVSTLSLLLDLRMTLLLPIVGYNAISLTFVYADFPADIINKALDKNWVPWVIATFGVGIASASLILGRVMDIKFIGRFVFVIVGFFAHFAMMGLILGLVFFAGVDIFKHAYIIFPIALLLGVGASVYSVLPALMVSVFFTENSEAAFANLNGWQSLGYMAAFIWGPLLSVEVKLLILLGFLALGTVCCTALHLFVASFNAPGDQDSELSHKAADEEDLLTGQ